jgi:hypothetical protein
MSTVTTIKRISAYQKLLTKLKNAGGISANRKALKSLQNLFSKEIPKPDIEQLRTKAWRTN